MPRTVVTAFVLATVWVAWSWHFEPLVVGFGAASVALTVLMARRLGILDEEGAPVEFAGRLLLFVPWLAWQVILANIAVAKIILSPKIPIDPHLIRLPANQRTVLGRTIHANTITLTPGTISLDLRDGVILVHALDKAFADEDSTGVNDRMICWLEGSAAKKDSSR